ncbi:MAG: glycosyltransferase family 4 protein [Deltaproteobacteria bacterium]|nr:glycosyltransferase family 4 protein [Deltaproteobacteria bacterium]
MDKTIFRIAYVATPIEFAGAERVSLNFLRNVNRDLFHIHLLLLLRPWEENNFFQKEIHNLNYFVNKIPVAKRPRSQGTDYARILRSFGQIFSILKNGSFDLIHIHGYFADILGIVSAKLLRIPVISTCHGFIESDRKLALYICLDRLVLRFSDRIIAVSADIQQNLTESGIRSKRIKVIPNAVETEVDQASFSNNRHSVREHFGFCDTDFVLGYAGRLSQEKGLSHLIEAVSLARKRDCPARLLIIGEGSQEDELRMFARKEELEDHVLFAGFRSDVGRFFPAMDAFVLPSLTEGTPMALLEAMAHGIPAIASAVGQIPEIIDSGKSGILVRPRDPEQIADAILFFHNNPSIREAMAKEGREKVKSQFDVKNWARQIENEYLSIVNCHP